MIHVLAGTGSENILNGPRNEAAFAQPSGLATDGHNLLRRRQRRLGHPQDSALALGARHDARRHVGPRGGPLAVRVRRRGRHRATAARFQHPLGLAYHDGRPFRRRHLQSQDQNNRHQDGPGQDLARQTASAATASIRPNSPSRAAFRSPAGNSTSPTRTTTSSKWPTCELGKVTTPPHRRADAAGRPGDGRRTIKTNRRKRSRSKSRPQHVAPGDALRLEISFKLPEGYKLNESAPASCRLRAARADRSDRCRPNWPSVTGPCSATTRLVVTIPLAQQIGQGESSKRRCRSPIAATASADCASWAARSGRCRSRWRPTPSKRRSI